MTVRTRVATRSVLAALAMVFLVAVAAVMAHGQNVISSSRSIDGTVYTYTLQGGEESLRVSGPLPEGFLIDKAMHDFRSALDVASDSYGGASFTHTFTYRQANAPTTSPMPSSSSSPPPSAASSQPLGTTTTPPATAPQRTAQARPARATPAPAVLEPLTPPTSSSASQPPPAPPIPASSAGQANDKYKPHYSLWNDAEVMVEDDVATAAASDKATRSKSLIEALSDFIATTPLARMQQYFSYYGTVFRSKERQEELQVVRDEFYSVEDDLAKISQQQLILRSRQAELGRYISDNMRRAKHERLQAVDDLVQMEDDRLALLEHRLSRMKQRLLKQRAELLQFLDALSPHAPDVVGGALGKDDNAEEVHLFTSTLQAVDIEDQE